MRSVISEVQKVNCPEGERETTLGCAPGNDFIEFCSVISTFDLIAFGNFKGVQPTGCG